MSVKPSLGVCYYPEQWPCDMWQDDARRMQAAGLSWVRIGEFAWSRIEPAPERFAWDWLERAIDVLGNAGLKVILGTPTATPPRWMIERHPDMLAVDACGNARKFGSRRHYCFSHAGYRRECARIVEQLAQRYGNNAQVQAWQVDNEYGCHDTVISYSDAARLAFQQWLRQRYSNIESLNQAWGNVFWSMEYSDFEQIDLPNLTVTEPNPAHQLAFRRFSSDQVIEFNRLQVKLIRQYSAAPVLHNYMGGTIDFDHFKLGADLDIATWDSYPLGFLEDRIEADANWKRRYSRQGDPDYQAFHHDLYRAVGRGRWWVMEQQPGPINWANYNPDPLPGMLKLWTWEAFAHGAEVVSYFRWRQAPFAQEQLHSGLLRPDNAASPALQEVMELGREIKTAAKVCVDPSPVGLLLDYDADSSWLIQSHGAGLTYRKLLFAFYRALRSLGLSLDILPTTSRNFDDYSVVLAPGLMHIPDALKSALSTTTSQVVLGPCSAARTAEMSITQPLPPDFTGLDLLVNRVESIRPDSPIALRGGGEIRYYREFLESSAEVIEQTTSGEPVVVAKAGFTYIGAWLDDVSLTRVCKRVCRAAAVEILELPPGVRIRDAGSERFWFNYNADEQRLGSMRLPPVSVFREKLNIE